MANESNRQASRKKAGSIGLLFRQLSNRGHPYSEAVVALSILPSIGLVIFQAAFDAGIFWQWAIIYVIDVLYVASMCVNSVAGYVKRGVLVTQWRKVVLHYLTRGFVPDVISVLPIEFLALAAAGFTEQGLTWAAILRLNRCIRCYRVWFYLGKR